MKFNVGKMFLNRAFLSPDMEACVGEGYRMTYEEVNERVNRFSSFLKQKVNKCAKVTF